MNMLFFSLLSFAASATATALPGRGPPSYGPGHGGPGGYGGHSGSNSKWDLKKFSTLVTFGDSYTDDSRLAYFTAHNGSAPPPGWVDPPNPSSASGGYPWPEFIVGSTGVRLYNYAVSGAECSNSITPRYVGGTDFLFPTVQEYEIPAWIADMHYVEPDGTKFFIAPQDETVYSMWIGTNDLGNAAILTDSQVPGTNITTYIDCVYNALQRIYDNGGRYFVLQNVAPLQLAPLYATPQDGGVGPNHYWPQKPSNITEISYRMMEQVVTVNDIYEYRTPYEVVLARHFPGARFAVMDMYGLILDIYNNPTQYLNGTAPANVTGFDNHCSLDNSVCTRSASPDSYLWFDELHPSEQTDRVIARAFVDVVKGSSRWATYWSG